MAHDAETGEEIWASAPDSGSRRAGRRVVGGVPYEERAHVESWMLPSFDPELNLVYVGTSVTSPAPKFMLASVNGRHPDKALSAAFIRAAPPGRHCDGQGLYLVVQPTGTRSWVQRLVIRGRKRELGLGSTALVSLFKAREQALSNRKLAREGGDPLAEKRRAEGMLTFADAAARVVEQKRAGWRSPLHARTWLHSLERHAFPRIGNRPVSEVASADVLEVLTPIWHVKVQTARNVRQRISTVMEWAIAMNLRSDNPCDRLGPVLGKQNEVVRHMRALPHRDVAAAISTVQASNVAEAFKLAFEFLVLTAARWGEVRGARWDEMDTSAHVWTVPAARMKANREHRVPLCRRVLDILDAARTLDTGPARSCSRPATGRCSTRRCSGGCWSGSGWPPCLTASGRRFGIGRLRRRSTVGRSSRRRWPTWSATRWRRRTPARTCSRAADSSWTIGAPTSARSVGG